MTGRDMKDLIDNRMPWEDEDAMERLRLDIQDLINSFSRKMVRHEVGLVVLKPDADRQPPSLVVVKVSRWRKKVTLAWDWPT